MDLQLVLEVTADPSLEGVGSGEDEEASSPRRVARGLVEVEVEEEGGG